MSTRDPAIRVNGLGKAYTISHQASQHSTLAEAMLDRVRHPFRRAQHETFWAVKDVTFDVPRGEVVGVIGRNGAGKSTLLKLLSRITEPTCGRIDLYGRVGSLLEVGTGFHPELTGRENIFLNGGILGMRRREIERQFDAIVAFAGVDQFLDTPVKRYSSGMYVRLAFAVAAHLRSEILIVDEVLAVGDAEFQKRCLGKMKDVATSGRTVLFVSHSMQAISTLCTSAIYMEAGRVAYHGGVQQAMQRYLCHKPTNGEAMARRAGSGELRLADVVTDRSTYLSTDDLVLEGNVIGYRDSVPSYFLSLEVVNQFGLVVLHLDSRLLNTEYDWQPRRRIRYRIRQPRLAQGDYSVNIYLCHAAGVIDRCDRAATFTVAPILPYPCGRGDIAGAATVYPEFSVEEVEPEPSAIVAAGANGNSHRPEEVLQ
jgi:lipopolysaccharide transport system ATP-binding protein